jgi:hypothetical protein
MMARVMESDVPIDRHQDDEFGKGPACSNACTQFDSAASPRIFPKSPPALTWQK